MATPKYEPTEGFYQMAKASGRRGGAWIAFANRTGTDQRTAYKYYHNTWLEAKDTQAMDIGQDYIDLIKLGIEKAKTGDVSEIMIVAKAIDNFLGKRGGEEWSTKQQIEQTNVNVETNQADYSKLSEEEKATMRAIMLKIKG